MKTAPAAAFTRPVRCQQSPAIMTHQCTKDEVHAEEGITRGPEGRPGACAQQPCVCDTLVGQPFPQHLVPQGEDSCVAYAPIKEAGMRLGGRGYEILKSFRKHWGWPETGN